MSMQQTAPKGVLSYSESQLDHQFKQQARLFKDDLDIFYKHQADKFVEFMKDIQTMVKTERKSISDEKDLLRKDQKSFDEKIEAERR